MGQSYKAAKMMASANKEIAGMNIAAQSAFLAKEQAYNTEMWERTNEYNTPTNQMQRYRDAGLNPYMMMQGQDAGTASAQSSPSLSAPQAPAAPDYASARAADQQNLLSSIGSLNDSLNSLSSRENMQADSNLKNAQADAMWTDASFRRQMNTLQVMRGLSEIRGIDENTKGKALQNYVDQQSQSYYIQRNKQDTYLQRANIAKLSVDTLVQQEMLPYMKEEARASVAAKMASVSAVAQNIKESKARIKYIDEQIDGLKKDNKLKDYSDEQLARIKEATVELAENNVAESEFRQAESHARAQGQRYQNFVDKKTHGIRYWAPGFGILSR